MSIHVGLVIVNMFKEEEHMIVIFRLWLDCWVFLYGTFSKVWYKFI